MEGINWANCFQRQCRVLRKLYNSAKDATAKSVRSLHSGDIRKYSLRAERVNPHLRWEPHGFLTADRFKLGFDRTGAGGCSRVISSQSAKQKIRGSLRSNERRQRAICMMRAIALSSSADTVLHQIHQFVDDNDDVGNFTRNLVIVFGSRHR
jgi:hypothetical protein